MSNFGKHPKRILGKRKPKHKQKLKDYNQLVDDIANFIIPKKRAMLDFDIDESDNISKEESQYRILLCLFFTALILILPTTILCGRFSIKYINEIGILKSYETGSQQVIENHGKFSTKSYRVT